MIIEIPKLSAKRIERICARKKLTKHLLIEKEGKEVLRESEDSGNAWNGGDYKKWLQYIQYWMAEKSSCDMESGRNLQAGGFLFGTPVIVTFPQYGSDISVCFADESILQISLEEWDQVDQWESICASDWGLHFNYK